MRVAVLGGGRQGRAGGHLLARTAGITEVSILDRDPEVAARAAARLSELCPGGPCIRAHPSRVDAADEDALRRLLDGFRGLLAAVPYRFLLPVTRAAVDAGIRMVDLGGHTATVFRQLELDASARKNDALIVPDCGLAPGLGNALAGALLRESPGARGVRIYCGGLPQNPHPPLGYRLFFHVAGLTNEYSGKAVVLRDGVIAEIPTLQEEEIVEFLGVGELRARTTSGGTSTAPFTFEGELDHYQYKTLRYPGHWEAISLLRDLGLFSQDAVEREGRSFVPRQVLHHLLEECLAFPGEPEDMVALRVELTSPDGSKRVEVLDSFDHETGFSAMERTTGYSAAWVLARLLAPDMEPGVRRLETLFSLGPILSFLRGEGMKVRHETESGASPARCEGLSQKGATR